jgi:hypothetical protein
MAPRPLVYLDQWALSDISKDSGLRPRLLAVLTRGTLLLSFMNLMEIARTKGSTFENIVSFFDEIGTHWASITLNSSEVGDRERIGELEPWRTDFIEHLLSAPGVNGKLSNLVRRSHEPWAEAALKLWENQEAKNIGDMLAVARERVRKGDLKLDRTSGVPEVLDSRNVFATVIQRYVRGSLKLDRNQIDDLLHTIIPVTYADVVFLDTKTKELLTGMDTRAQVFSKNELERGIQYLEDRGHRS